MSSEQQTLLDMPDFLRNPENVRREIAARSLDELNAAIVAAQEKLIAARGWPSIQRASQDMRALTDERARLIKAPDQASQEAGGALTHTSTRGAKVSTP